MKSRFLLMRHGESTWNEIGRWQGQADPPLSDRGERQAVEAGSAFGELASFDVVYSSTLQRARRTGEVVAVSTGLELGSALEGLEERAAGAWQGLTRVEIEEQYPGFLDRGERPAGYEDDESIVKRASATLRHLAKTCEGGCAIVVSHGGVINALERHAVGGVNRWSRVDNLEGRWFEVGSADVAVIGERVHLLDRSISGTNSSDYA